MGTGAWGDQWIEKIEVNALDDKGKLCREKRVEFDVDALVTPTSPVTAFKLGEMTGDPVQMYLIDVCTLPVNIAGLPGLSVPCGFSEGLPVGMQLIGPHFSEETLLRIGHAYEAATLWSDARAAI